MNDSFDWINWMVENKVRLTPVQEKKNQRKKTTKILKWCAGKTFLCRQNYWLNYVPMDFHFEGKTPIEAMSKLKNHLDNISKPLKDIR